MLPKQVFTLNTTSLRTYLSVLGCFQPIYKPGDFTYSTMSEPYSLQINCRKWGDIGQIICQEIQPGKTLIRFAPPGDVTPNNVAVYETLIRDECLKNRQLLADLFPMQDQILATLSQALYQKRGERQIEFRTWLMGCLKIFGYRDLDLVSFHKNVEPASKVNSHFDFLIKGTPAQFGVMLRQYALSMRNQPEYQKLTCRVSITGNTRETDHIPPEANPVEANLILAKNKLSISSHLLPSGETLLRVSLSGEQNTWLLWDKIRDELEKLGWFELPPLPEPSKKLQPESIIQEEVVDAKAPWLVIPNIGPNREIVQFWYKGLTCEQIALRVSLSKKTVLNRINKLRNQYGLEVVPYRKSNLQRKRGNLPS